VPGEGGVFFGMRGEVHLKIKHTPITKQGSREKFNEADSSRTGLSYPEEKGG